MKRWALLIMLAGCGAPQMCPEALQVCLTTDVNGLCHFTYAECCGSTYVCKQGTLASAPGTCSSDATIPTGCP